MACSLDNVFLSSSYSQILSVLSPSGTRGGGGLCKMTVSRDWRGVFVTEENHDEVAVKMFSGFEF